VTTETNLYRRRSKRVLQKNTYWTWMPNSS